MNFFGLDFLNNLDLMDSKPNQFLKTFKHTFKFLFIYFIVLICHSILNSIVNNFILVHDNICHNTI